MRLQDAVEIIENDAGFDHGAAALDIKLENPVEVFRAIDDQPGIHRLPALRRAAAAHRERDVRVAGGQKGHRYVTGRLGDDHARRHHLVDRRIGGITPA